VTANEILNELYSLGGFHSVLIPEFTYGGLRIDAAIVDVRKRWIRGFEIKVTRSDFLSDKKWTSYTQFCSSLSIVCPEGLIDPDEIKRPFGLLWVGKNKFGSTTKKWKKMPQNFQKRDCLAWLWTYVSVIETELPRLKREIETLEISLDKKN